MMAKAKLNEVYEEIKKEARAELLKELQPKIERLKTLGDEVLSSLSAFKSGRKTAVRRGRKPGPKPGRKPAVKKRAAGAKRAPAGALNPAIGDVLAKQQQPVGLVQIRNEVLKSSLFKKHDPKNLYNQIIQTIKKVKGVSKTGKGYAISK